MSRNHTSRTELARLGFTDTAVATERLATLPASLGTLFALAADPDQALRLIVRLRERASAAVDELLAGQDAAAHLVRILGASAALGEFFERHPEQLAVLREPLAALPTAAELGTRLAASVSVDDVRVRYRRELVRIAAWDLASADPLEAVEPVAAALADLAGATLDAALTLARGSLRFPATEVADMRLAIIGMGKAGARELNYISDVDVIYVVDAVDETSVDRAVVIGAELAKAVSHIVNGNSVEPALWELDANLRPEGADGALVRTLASHVAYYERWAQSWEFQALLKARPLAGDLELGLRYVDAITPFVWSSAKRENFVDSVQRMRERVTEHIPAEERDVQLKLGLGGLRDVEFTIQLLQLVHGQTDESVRLRDTLGALGALAAGGYIGRDEAASFARDYRFLRLLEHRIQLANLVRSHLMPRDDERLRVLARASGQAGGSGELVELWQATRVRVRGLHERLFYRPLLSAVASLPGEDFQITSEQAVARLAGVGFVDPEGALRHIAALTSGLSRRATIQRNLLPILLQWLAEGADPDHGLLTFRRLSETLGESHWYLRMLRDSSGTAHRLMRLLSGSRFIGDLFLNTPEAVAWLSDDEELAPRSLESLLEEGAAIIGRHTDTIDDAAAALRGIRRREILRLAIAGILQLRDVQQLGHALTDVTEALITSALALARGTGVDGADDGIEFAVIAMGRYGGRELGFGSDADVMYVYRAITAEPAAAQSRAEQIVLALRRLTDDIRIRFDLDEGLRPEGKNGAIVRSLESYRAYYERWSLTWEAQALLRARYAAGDEVLGRDFEALADEVRYPAQIGDRELREVKRIKARVEAERLPQGADPSRHLKLGRGSLSDIEWLVQLVQLAHASTVGELRTTSTLDALDAAAGAKLIPISDAALLRDTWQFVARARSALMLWTGKTTDVLPGDRAQLEGIARLLGYPRGSAGAFEDSYLRQTRQTRRVFERLFFD
ncbi:MAG: bifunctional [glutamine synthetase] adenylyltransferase/[glutamine synthetase]-adenylyl-L-tyrosine phosphorylase [Cryobacterium sp.]|nr:bifunctional [glutamine synthetase] adenylyltransferase/[glutamine synthetase]-adenylyl-L-tyrosine phosphorylase [Cryobacterium sp.]